MPPTLKQNDSLGATDLPANPAAPTDLSGDSPAKQQPVALEVPVTVNGARAVDGSEKREPFSESTRTVLVFGSGAVIRLSSSVAPGQLLFLTNDKTKKEVVCQVVKSKNYRNVSGYVELEFTEPMVGFWGMRFPSDRLGSSARPAAPAPVSTITPAAGGLPATPRPVSPGLEAPAAKVVPSIPAPKPVIPMPPAKAPAAPPAPISTIPEPKPEPLPATPVSPLTPAFDLQRASEEKASIFETPQEPPPPPTIDLGSLAPFFEVRPTVTPAQPTVPPAPVSRDTETETLKQETARLQEQLSSMLFTEPAPVRPPKGEAPAPATPRAEKPEVAEATAKILEIAKAPDHAPLRSKPAESANATSPSLKSSFDEEEMKIPAWLEPLARNAAAPVSTHDLIEREKAKHASERHKTEEHKSEEIAAEPVEVVEEHQMPEAPVPVPSFGSALPIDGESGAESDSPHSGRGGLYAAIAATVLLVSGGWWYINQHAGRGPLPAAPVAKPSSNVAAAGPVLQNPSQGNEALPANPPAPTNSAAGNPAPIQSSAASQSKVIADSEKGALANESTKAARNPRSSNSGRGGALVAAAEPAQPEPAQVKNASLGEVHLAAPKVGQKRKAQNGEEAEPGLALNNEQPDANGDALGAGLMTDNKPPAPAAPVAVGGDVKQAKLIFSVQPSYPTLAKSQHVSGNVQIDALIDANGRVTTMKIVSGPTLLQQAAMDALRQWKYQPATLDGKPVPMHLTVTLQFRLQQ